MRLEYRLRVLEHDPNLKDGTQDVNQTELMLLT
jgi:hypothetical protein